MGHMKGALSVIAILICVGIWGVPLDVATGGREVVGVAEIHSCARLVACDGYIMFIDPVHHYFTLKEKQIILGDFMINNSVLSTRLENANGRSAGLEQFRVGQWVAIRGYEVSQAKIYACSVQAAKGYLSKDLLRIGKFDMPRHH